MVKPSNKEEIEIPDYSKIKAPIVPAMPQLTPEQIAKIEEARRAEVGLRIKQVIDDAKVKAEKFKDKATQKFKQEIKGILVMPPKPQRSCPKCDSPDVDVDFKKGICKNCHHEWNVLDVLVVLALDVDNFEEERKKRKEIEDKLTQIGKETMKDINVATIYIKDMWDMCFKGKNDILGILSIGVPVFDSGWISVLRGCDLHKTMVLKKFEKYVVTYIVAGSFIRGESKKGSDVDVYIVIDDTDVTRMTGGELQSKLRSIVSSMAWEAKDMSGSEMIIHPQVWILSDMWNSLKNANPVIFTVVRDGVPFYDRGLFSPWRLLLKQGKVTPSPEAVTSQMKFGKEYLGRIKYKLKDIALDDFFWATFTPTQGALMMVGVAPPTPKETVALARKHLMKPGLLDEKDIQILERILKLRKDVEHGEVQDVSGKDIADRLADAEKYLEKLEKIFKKLEENTIKDDVNALYDKSVDDVIAALKIAEVSAKPADAFKLFKSEVISKKLAPARYGDVLEKITEIKKTFKTDRMELASLMFEQDKFAKESFELIAAQKGRKIDKFKISASYSNKRADIWLLSDTAFIVMDTSKADTKIVKLKVNKDGSLDGEQESSLEKLNETLEKFAGTPTTITKATIESLKRLLHPDVKLIVGA